MIFSAPISVAHRCTSDGGIGAAPIMIHSRLERSTSSTPGRSPIRCSIVGVQVKVVMRWRSITSTIRAASNFSRTYSSSPESMLLSVANALMWYIGASTRIRCGRVTLIQASAIGTLIMGSNTGGPSERMTFGVPVAPLLQIPWLLGETTSGRSGAASSAVARIQSRSSGPRYTVGWITSLSRSSSQSGTSQRTGTGTAPSFQIASTPKTNSGEFLIPSPTRSA